MSEKALYAALSKAQAEMPVVPFDSQNPFLKKRFASLGATIEVARPVLAKHGLALMQFPVSNGDRVGIRNVLTHSEGASLEYEVTLPLGDEKGKSQAQLAGSIITYLRRYSMQAILFLYGDEDTDANPPQKPAGQRRQPEEPVRIPEADQGQKQAHKRSWPADLIMRLVGEVDDIKAPPHAVNVMNLSPFVEESDDELNYTAIIAWAKARKEESDD